MSERARNKGGVGRSGRPRRDLRLFVAAYPGKAWSDRAIEGLGLLDLPPHRVTPAEQVHLTLCFLGSVDRARLPGITESVGLAASGLHAFDLDPTRLITLPERGPARLVAAECGAPPGLLELVRRLATRLASAPRPDPADRFLPHLTLCRFRTPARGFTLDRTADDLDSFRVGEIRLMRSVLLPGGAEHREMARFWLG